jgi:hypothetical protein
VLQQLDIDMDDGGSIYADNDADDVGAATDARVGGAAADENKTGTGACEDSAARGQVMDTYHDLRRKFAFVVDDDTNTLFRLTDAACVAEELEIFREQLTAWQRGVTSRLLARVARQENERHDIGSLPGATSNSSAPNDAASLMSRLMSGVSKLPDGRPSRATNARTPAAYEGKRRRYSKAV